MLNKRVDGIIAVYLCIESCPLCVLLYIQAMAVLDIDEDGKIDFDEFKSFMLRANVNETSEISSELLFCYLDIL